VRENRQGSAFTKLLLAEIVLEMVGDAAFVNVDDPID
jgi:hypothetical protein